MSISRWLELGSGLAPGVVGLAIIAFVWFGPVYQTTSGVVHLGPNSSSTCTGAAYGPTTLAQVNHGIPPLALLYSGALAILLLGVGASTLVHYRRGSNAWCRCLWIVTGLLKHVALAGFDLWVFMLPGVLLALVAALAAQNDEPVAAG